MKLDDSNLLNHNKNNETKDNFLINMMKQLQNLLGNFTQNPSSNTSNTILEDSIYVVRDINDNKLSLVNIDNGQEIDISVIDSQGKINQLDDNSFSRDIYEMSSQDLYNLNLGSNITIKNGKCIPYNGVVEIKNSQAAAKLEDMYFCIEQEKNAIYSVANVENRKIYLTNIEEGGYFSIPQDAYPDFKIGDLVKNINGKYVLI